MSGGRPALVLADDGRTLVPEVEVAASFLHRLRGWVWRAPAAGDAALWLVGVRAVHTLGLRGPIDVVFLGVEGTILAVRRRVAAARMVVGPRGTRHTLELPPGTTARLGLAVGQRLVLSPPLRATDVPG